MFLEVAASGRAWGRRALTARALGGSFRGLPVRPVVQGRWT